MTPSFCSQIYKNDSVNWIKTFIIYVIKRLYMYIAHLNFEILDQQLNYSSQMMTQLVYLMDRYHK